jgi:alginate O-acetyltransferase complex protein AlgI
VRALGFDVHWTAIHVTLPVGISFFTFHTLSYTIDVYRRKIPATSSPIDFALYIAFFPQLVAGPIVRASVFLPQLAGPIRIACDQATFFLIVRGLAKKVFVADNLAVLPDAVFSSPQDYPSAIVWLAAICFAVQIYCDFSGYSDIAIGLSKVLGFRLPLNFDHPYLARNPSDFWRRWHISLSSWLRDYLYVSLGGNREGRARTYRNLMITMLLGGLWHGASWNFVLWGFLHGVFLVIHRFYGELRRRTRPDWQPSQSWLSTLLSILAMQYCVVLAWIPFRAADLATSLAMMRKFVFFDFDFGLANIGLGTLSFFSTLILLAAFAALHGTSRALGQADRFLGRVGLGFAAAVCFAFGFLAVILWPLSDQPFIYFQF